MRPEELSQHCDRQEGFGLDRIMLTMPVPKSGLRGHRLRTPFGLAEIANVSPDGSRVLFWVEIAKVRRYVKRALASQGSGAE